MIVYLNGDWCEEAEARISPFDRGFLMADGIYEVTSVMEGRLVDYPAHMARLDRSVREMHMTLPVAADALLSIHRALLSKNGISEGGVYLQLTRGAPAGRDFLWPTSEAVEPTLFVYAFSKPLIDTAVAKRGVRVKSVPDLRWARRDIKTIQLLYPSEAKSLAHAQGYDDVWMVEDGYVTEGSSSNAHIISNGRVITRPLSNDILHGITRAALLKYAAEAGIGVEERAFTIEEAQAAEEAFATSSTGLVQPVVAIDGVPVASGAPGERTQRLREIYVEESLKRAI
ncbi:D-amino-acid transaminase [Martelella sp. AMO21009]